MLGFDNFFLFRNKSARGTHDVFRELEVTTSHLNNNPHMHDQLGIIPEETRGTSLGSTVTKVTGCERKLAFHGKDVALRVST